jgi:hypothetical protein
MNTPIPIMLAHGVTVVLPALVVLVMTFLVYAATLWAVVSSRDGKRSPLITASAAVVVVASGIGSLATLKDFSSPPDWGDYFGLLIWMLPVLSGAVVLARALRRNSAHE